MAPLTTPLGSVFDAHVDSLQLALDLGIDLGAEGPGHLDLVRGRRGGLASVVLVSWVDPAFIEPAMGGARARTSALLRKAHELFDRCPDQVAWAGNGSLRRAAREAGRIAGIPGIEGGHSIEGDLEVLRHFFEAGVRVLTLVWNNHLPWIRSCQPGAGPEVPAGLSDFGRDVVREMNRLGMLIDLSHASDEAFFETLELTTRPVIASHSGCRSLHAHPRNLTDDQLRQLGASGGVVGLVFLPAFLSASARAEDAKLRQSAEFKGLAAPNECELFLAQARFLQEYAPPLEVDCLLDHICHAVEVAGLEHVGLGSDYDGIQRTPKGLESAACYGAVERGLSKRGFDAEEVRRLMGGNMERVFDTVTGPGSLAHERTGYRDV